MSFFFLFFFLQSPQYANPAYGEKIILTLPNGIEIYFMNIVYGNLGSIKMTKIIKIITLVLIINLFACLMARFEYDKHPDFNFPPTDAANVVIYDRFLPSNKFIIIGRIVTEQALFTDMKKSVQRMQEISESMGGDGIIISGSQIAWVQYNKAVTTGAANIYDFGYSMYVTGTMSTTYYQMDVPTKKNIIMVML
jgi:hypothetical protein